jgi:hypothetical protein
MKLVFFSFAYTDISGFVLILVVCTRCIVILFYFVGFATACRVVLGFCDPSLSNGTACCKLDGCGACLPFDSGCGTTVS